MYRDMDHPEGFHMYEAMRKLAPHFIVPTGDNVYYDSEDPRATTVELARYHWHRMYSYPHHVAFYLQVPAYWEKDDHDTLFDDCWPTMNPPQMLPLSFADGQRIFLEQVPLIGEKTFRTYRWGKGLQVWLTEGRDFRSSNKAPDGPGKTIWGAAQKKWLMESLLASDADFKVLVSPTPIVGPDRTNKADNHSNAAFAHEGSEFRAWVQKNLPSNFFVACGDRHWQYHSVHPDTGVQEFSSGPASDQHAAGSPGYNPRYHKFHLVKGGFLAVNFLRAGAGSRIIFRLHDVHGKTVYEYARNR
jgi:alkaline phosphatase D